MGQHHIEFSQHHHEETTKIKKKKKEYIYLMENSLMKDIFNGETCCSITV